MLEINSSNIRQWSRFGSRAVYGQALLDAAKDFPSVVALSADLGNSSGLDRFKATFPERFINVGIAEQNLIGVAAGIAKEGFNAFASSFAPFITMRACEQLRMNLGYMELNVKAVGIGSGLVMGFLGNSHFGLEDIAITRAIPNLTIVAPADCTEIVKVVRAAAEFEGPMYIRLTGGPNNPPAYQGDYDLKIGRSIQMRDGKDVAIAATGSMVAASLTAAALLESDGISTAVFNFHTLKPVDQDCLRHLSSQYNLIFAVEEHSVVGGLFSAITETLASDSQRPLIHSVALPDAFGKTADYGVLLDRYHLTPEGIRARILSEVASDNVA